MTSTTDHHLPSYAVRPRFKIESTETMENISNKIKIALKAPNAPCTGKMKPRFFTLHIPEEEQHYWSPQLTITLDETEQGCTIRGVYAPRPSVWTMFVFFYSIIAMAIFVISIVGVSYWSLQKESSIMWFVPVLGIVFLSLYLVAFFGQKMGHKQMEQLHQFFEKSTGLSTL